jgi:hypothetical protein
VVNLAAHLQSAAARQSAAVAEHGSVGARELRAGLNEISVKGMA